MATSAQITANQANALKSTGPITPEGKAQVRNSALRHGLTSRHLVLPGENIADFENLLEQHLAQYAPATETERNLVTEIAEHAWRLIRARRVETCTLDLYMARVGESVEGNPEVALAVAFHQFGRELDRLRRYETTIVRAHARAIAELRSLIQMRQAVAPKAAAPLEAHAVSAIGSVSQTSAKPATSHLETQNNPPECAPPLTQTARS